MKLTKYTIFFLTLILTITSFKIFADEGENLTSGLEEIVVTSQKTAVGENVQNLSIAATVLTDVRLDAVDAIDIEEFGRLVPGAQLKNTSTFPGYTAFFIRGSGTSGSVPSFDPAVGSIIDGVYIGQLGMSMMETWDWESVEILRGPQGTVLGRNFTGGAIVARSKRPEEGFSAKIEATGGSDGRQDIGIVINGTIVENLDARLAVLRKETDGYVKDLSGTGAEPGNRETTIIRPSIRYTPNDALEILLLAELHEAEGWGGVSMHLTSNADGSSGLAGPRGFYETYPDESQWNSSIDHDRQRYLLEMNLDLDQGTLTGIFAHIRQNDQSGTDFDGIPANIVSTATSIKQHQNSQEIIYASNLDGPFNFTTGIYLFEQEFTYVEQRSQGKYCSVNAFCLNDSPNIGNQISEQTAVYFQGTYDFNDRLSLTVGGRYAEEEKRVKMALLNSGKCTSLPNISDGKIDIAGWGDYNCAGFDITDKAEWDDFSHKVALEYLYNDDILFYISHTSGFKGGGYTFRAPVADLTFSEKPGYFEPEEVEALEIGVKADLFDNRVRINLALYKNDLMDIQKLFQNETSTAGTSGVEIYQRINNVADSEVEGIEIEINAIIGESLFTEGDLLQGEFSLGTVDASHKSFVDFNGDGVSDSDKDFAGIPEMTYYFALNYEHPLASGTMRYRASIFHKDEYEGNAMNTALAKYREQDLVDAHIQYTSANDNWYLKIFGKNLTEEEYYKVRVPFTSSFGVAFTGPPREYGVKIGYKF